MKKISVFLNYSLSIFLPILLTLIPKNRNLWVFSAWSGLQYSDNPRAMYEYVRDNTDQRAIWITKSKELSKKLTKKNIKAYYYLSFLGVFYQITAKIIFLSHNIGADYCRFLISKNTIRVNLWHGMPFKKIRFDDRKTYSDFSIKIKSSKSYIFISNESYSHIASLGPRSTNILSKALGHAPSKFLEFGFPRNDALVKNTRKRVVEIDDLKIVYLPTFRNSVGSEYNLLDEINFDLNVTVKVLSKINATLMIKFHPANLPNKSMLESLSKCARIFISKDDATNLLANCDVLITDYSSVMFDFALTRKPIIFFQYDKNKYFSNDRESYFLDESTDKEFSVTTWNECLSMFAKIREGVIANTPDWLEDLHQNKDGKSCQKIHEYLYKRYVI